MMLSGTVGTVGTVGALLVLLGASVMVGWWLQIAPLVRVLPQLPSMVFNTAVAFTLAGAALLRLRPGASRPSRLAAAAGGLLTLLALWALAEHLLRSDLGIDQPAWHAWLHDASRQPGRVSAGAAFAFLLAGAALTLAPFLRGRRTRNMIRLLTSGVGLIGALSLAGHFINAPLMFPDYWFADVALHAAIGLMLLAYGMTSVWRRFEWGQAPLFANDHDRITFTGATILVVVALCTAVALFAILQGRFQTLTLESVQAAQSTRARTFEDMILLRENNARIAATRPAVLANLRVIQNRRDDGSNLANVKAVVNGLLQQGFSGMAYQGADGSVVAGAGAFVHSPVIAVKLATPDQAELMWDDGFVLRHRIAMRDAEGPVGEVLVEQPLTVLTRIVRDMETRGETWDMGLCVKHEPPGMRCFPQRLSPNPFEAPLVNVTGAPLPMTRAFAGETGTVITHDYRAKNVFAAYGPVGQFGLGMVVKVDAVEVLQPIRDQLLLATGVLSLFALSGTWLLRRRLQPLVGKLVDAETQARLQERKFRDLLESAPDAMIIADRMGRIVLVNSQTEALFGYSRAELLGQTVELLLPQRYRGRHPEHRDGYFAEPKFRAMGGGLELFGQRRDGSEFPIEVSLSPLETEPGTLVTSAIRDISERKQVERALLETNLALANASRAKDNFLANMSHELRTPLNAILGFTGILLMKLPGPLTEKQEQQLSTVKTSAQHLLALITDLLDIAKIGAGKFEPHLEPVDCKALVEEVAATLRPQAEGKGLQLGVEAPAEAMLLHTDRRALNQILLNLVGNAVKFTEQGRVQIQLSRSVDRVRRVLQVSVHDTGIGIALEDQPKLFEAYSRVDSSHPRHPGGTGLGLHLSRMLAEALGGNIRLRSELGIGSTFTLVLPDAAPSPSPPSP